jgi:ABC-type Fe3+-siderophore transport system permease subunit
VKCPYCGGELTQKSRASLLAASLILFIGAVASFFLIPLFWIIGLLFLVTAVYLFAWSTRGKGLWCRQCKKFPGR